MIQGYILHHNQDSKYKLLCLRLFNTLGYHKLGCFSFYCYVILYMHCHSTAGSEQPQRYTLLSSAKHANIPSVQQQKCLLKDQEQHLWSPICASAVAAPPYLQNPFSRLKINVHVVKCTVFYYHLANHTFSTQTFKTKNKAALKQLIYSYSTCLENRIPIGAGSLVTGSMNKFNF